MDAESEIKMALIRQLVERMSGEERPQSEKRNWWTRNPGKTSEQDRSELDEHVWLIRKVVKGLLEQKAAETRTHDQAFTRYLMNEMSDKERSEFEDLYLGDPELFEELVAVEHQMMRSYVRGGGSEAERAAFENRYLGTREGRQRVDFAKALMQYVDSVHETGPSTLSQDEPQTPKLVRWWRKSVLFIAALDPVRLAATISILALLAGVSWLSVMDSRLSLRLEQMQARHAGDLRREQELRVQLTDTQARLQQQEQQLEQLSGLGSAVLPFTVSSHLVREGSPRKPLVIPREFSSVFLQAVMERNDYSRYVMTIETPEGRQIWRLAGLAAWRLRDGTYSVGLIMPANIFESSNYILTVKGYTAAGNLEEVASYSFRVTKQPVET